MAGKRKATATPPPDPRPSRMEALRTALSQMAWRFVTDLLLPLSLPVLLVSALLLGLYALQPILRSRLGAMPTTFTDIQCSSPAGVPQEDFLSEVQYLARLPDRVDLLDTPVLTAAFGKHPWVERVERISIAPDRRVQVVCRLRHPVLAVRYEEKCRVVDGRGVLLPERAATEGLPLYVGPLEVVPLHSGAIWGDARLTAAARVAAYLDAYRDRLRIEKVTVDERGILLRTAWGRTIVWGSPPEAEPTGEASAATKVQVLLNAGLSAADLDLRW